MSGDLEQSAYTADSGNAVENTAVDTAATGGAGNVMPGVWQVPVAIPVALPVAIPVKELVSRVSLRLILLSGGSFLLGYLILPLIGMMFIRQPDGAAAGVLSLVCPFFSIAALLAGGWLMHNCSMRKLAEDLNLGPFPVFMFLVWGFPLALGIALCSGVITVCWQALANAAGWGFGVPPTVDVMENQDHYQVAAMAVTALLAAPFYEEVIFRRVLFGTVYQYCGKIAAYAVTAAAFGAVHLSLLQFPAFLVVSSLWQFFYVRERNLWLSILLHFFNNSIAITLLLIARYKDFLIELLTRLSASE